MKKNLFRTFPALFAGMTLALMATSCGVENKAEDALPRLTVDKNRVEVTKNGLTANGDVATVQVVANKGFTVTSDAEWLKVGADDSTGIASKAVKINADYNDSGEIREATLTVTSVGNLVEHIVVVQNLEEAKDDGNPVGYQYFFDDFSWALGGSDAVKDKAAGNARNIYTWDFAGNGFVNPKPQYDATYDDINSNAKTCYVMEGYLKFDKTNTITAIAIRNNGITPGYTVNVAVKFKCARHGTDKCNIVVAIEGDGNIEGATEATVDGVSRLVSAPVGMTENSYEWSNVTVNISGATSATRIIIGDQTLVKDGVNNQGTFRWYLDDLTVERI